MREIKLRIPQPGLLIFYADQEGWRGYTFFIEEDSCVYQLSLVEWVANPPTGEYAFFVRLKEGQHLTHIRWAIKAGGYKIVKEDSDCDGRQRIWLIDLRKPTVGEGDEQRNVWVSREGG